MEFWKIYIGKSCFFHIHTHNIHLSVHNQQMLMERNIFQHLGTVLSQSHTPWTLWLLSLCPSHLYKKHKEKRLLSLFYIQTGFVGTNSTNLTEKKIIIIVHTDCCIQWAQVTFWPSGFSCSTEQSKTVRGNTPPSSKCSVLKQRSPYTTHRLSMNPWKCHNKWTLNIVTAHSCLQFTPVKALLLYLPPLPPQHLFPPFQPQTAVIPYQKDFNAH